MNKFYAIILACIVGVCSAIQPPINAALGKCIESKNAAMVSIFTSFTIIFIIVISSGNIKQVSNITKVHPIYWIGGVFGITMVYCTIKVIPILGTAAAFPIFVSVQLVVGVIINHFGLLGVDRKPVGAATIFGIIFLILGVILVVR